MSFVFMRDGLKVDVSDVTFSVNNGRSKVVNAGNILRGRLNFDFMCIVVHMSPSFSNRDMKSPNFIFTIFEEKVFVLTIFR